MPEDYITCDYLINGSGIAGLTSAIKLADRGARVAVATKETLMSGSSPFAQGGTNSLDKDRVAHNLDSASLFWKDSMRAAQDLGDPYVTRTFVKRSSETLDYFLESGVPFTRTPDGSLDWHQEGGHSRPRTAHVNDMTGRSIMEHLIMRAQANQNIAIYENHPVVDLITTRKLDEGARDNICLGAYVLDKTTGQVKTFDANATIIATGGAGRIFLYTSNDSVSTGDGIGIAYRAGAAIANMEFTQFHPTVLYGYNIRGRSFLLTEALRGKDTMGGILTLSDTGPESCRDFVKAHHELGSAGTRDVVARAIDIEMKRNGIPHVFLNVTSAVTGRSAKAIHEEFPQIHEQLSALGIDMAEQPIPVVPAAHYTCGGIVVGRHGEVQGIAGLYAIGEVACTGLMGANRLASNSLPEAALYGMLAAEHALAYRKADRWELPLWVSNMATIPPDHELIRMQWNDIRRHMWQYVGITRDEEGLAMADDLLRAISRMVERYYWEHTIDQSFLESRNIKDVALLAIRAARWRQESRGGHYLKEHPEKDSRFRRPSIQKRGIEGIIEL